MTKKTSACTKDMIGAVVVGERGQIVIPKDFRESIGLKAGSRLLVASHGDGAMLLIPITMMKEMMDKMNDKLSKFKNI